MKKEQAFTKNIMSLEHTAAAELFEKHAYPWEVLSEISGFIKEYQYVEDNKKQGGKTNETK